jgi:hypothetical protein
VSGSPAAIRELELTLGDGANVVELFGIDDDASGAQGHGSAGKSGSGSAGNHFESEAGDGHEQRRYLQFVVGRDDR